MIPEGRRHVSLGRSGWVGSAPVVVHVTSQPGFNVLDGGKLARTYTIGDCTHCELATPLINATIPGPGNSITLKLGEAKIVG